MAHGMMACGRTTGSTAMGLRHGPMVLYMRANIKWARNMAVDSSSGMMVQGTLGNSSTITLKDMDNTFGLMDESTSVNGKRTRCMGLVFSRGLMVNAMKASIMKIRKRDTVSFTGRMEASMRVAGRTVSSMELARTPPLLVCSVWEHGQKASE